MGYAIVAEQLGKKFRRFHADKPRTLQETFVRGLRYLRPRETFWALRDVDFHVERGQIAGVLGRNGAGKTTLLHLIGGVARPDTGQVVVHGRIGGFLNLKAGFRPDLTGRENVFVGGVIAGLTRRQVLSRFDSIVEFAELEDFIDSPVRTYSTGMQMRLAFAVAAHTEPELLLIDEVLAVGDLAFRNKCFDRIKRFQAEGCTIVLVSHDTHLIKQFCDVALLLSDGRLIADGDPESVVEKYVSQVKYETQRQSPASPAGPAPGEAGELRMNENRFGSLEMEITKVRLVDAGGLPAETIRCGDPLRVEITFHAPQPIPSPIFSVAIEREDRQLCCTTMSLADGDILPTLSGDGKITASFDRLDLNGGKYFVNVGVYERSWDRSYDYHWRAYCFQVKPTPVKKGLMRAPVRWEMARPQNPLAEEQSFLPGKTDAVMRGR